MKPLNLGPGKGNGKVIKVRNAAITPNTAGFQIVLNHDRRDYLEGNVLRFENKRYWIAHRDPPVPDQANAKVTMELRLDQSTRRQRRKS